MLVLFEQVCEPAHYFLESLRSTNSSEMSAMKYRETRSLTAHTGSFPSHRVGIILGLLVQRDALDAASLDTPSLLGLR